MNQEDLKALSLLQHMITDDIRSKQKYRRYLLGRLARVDPDCLGGVKQRDRIWSRIASCFRYSTLYRGEETGKVSLEFHQCKSVACPFCRYWYTLRQRGRVRNTLGFMVQCDTRRSDRLYMVVPTKRDRSSWQEDAATSFNSMSKLLHGWLTNARKTRERGENLVNGGVYKIETTVSRYTFKEWSWHYHANVIIETEDHDKMMEQMKRAIPYRITCEKLHGDWLKELVKYSCKGIDEKKQDWNCDPFVEGPIRLLEDMLRLQKRRSLSFFGDYWGEAKRVELSRPRSESRHMIWTNYPPLERKLQETGRMQPIDDIPYQDVFEMVMKKSEQYSKLYDRAIDEYKKDTKVAVNT